jgi:hypothetical protein
VLFHEEAQAEGIVAASSAAGVRAA